MKSYRIYVCNEGVYHYQKYVTGKLSDVLSYCKNVLGDYGGYIKDFADEKILRRF